MKYNKLSIASLILPLLSLPSVLFFYGAIIILRIEIGEAYALGVFGHLFLLLASIGFVCGVLSFFQIRRSKQGKGKLLSTIALLLCSVVFFIGYILAFCFYLDPGAICLHI